MEKIKDTVYKVIGELKLKQSEDEATIFSAFKKILTRQERAHTRCVCLRKGVLTINVDSSPWLYQLNQRKETVLARLGIKEIRLRIGEISEK